MFVHLSPAPHFRTVLHVCPSFSSTSLQNCSPCFFILLQHHTSKLFSMFVHPSPAPNFKTVQVFVIYFPKCPNFSTPQSVPISAHHSVPISAQHKVSQFRHTTKCPNFGTPQSVPISAHHKVSQFQHTTKCPNFSTPQNVPISAHHKAVLQMMHITS